MSFCRRDAVANVRTVGVGGDAFLDCRHYKRRAEDGRRGHRKGYKDRMVKAAEGRIQVGLESDRMLARCRLSTRVEHLITEGVSTIVRASRMMVSLKPERRVVS